MTVEGDSLGPQSVAVARPRRGRVSLSSLGGSAASGAQVEMGTVSLVAGVVAAILVMPASFVSVWLVIVVLLFALAGIALGYSGRRSAVGIAGLLMNVLAVAEGTAFFANMRYEINAAIAAQAEAEELARKQSEAAALESARLESERQSAAAAAEVAKNAEDERQRLLADEAYRTNVSEAFIDKRLQEIALKPRNQAIMELEAEQIRLKALSAKARMELVDTDGQLVAAHKANESIGGLSRQKKQLIETWSKADSDTFSKEIERATNELQALEKQLKQTQDRYFELMKEVVKRSDTDVRTSKALYRVEEQLRRMSSAKAPLR